ncbi:MAG: hypothetical protein JWL89_674 [Candidatus Saccharibacteria bacterium]|nr:hypothetical protein [Candidatus Saccharibacteria bacterium]
MREHPYSKLDLRLPRKELIGHVSEAVEHARTLGEPVKVYRFGFFRLQFTPTRLEPGHSLHVWSRDLLDRDEAPHNHNSYMRSRVLLGRIANQFWKEPITDEQGPWRPTETICTDTVCEDRPSDYRASLELESEQVYGPNQLNGDYYEMPRGSLHSSEFDDGTVTLIHKADIDPAAPIINLLPHDQPPRLQAFDITSFPQDIAWSAVDDAVRRLQAS